jgi:hypothetical protein
LTRAPQAANRAQVEAHIAALQAKPPTPAPAPTPPPPTEAAPPTPRSGRTERLTGVSLISVGIGALVGGVVAGAYAKAEGDRLTADAHTTMPWDPERDAAGRRDQVLQGVFLGVGAAAVVTGTTLYLVGHARDGRWTLARHL